MPNTSLLLSFRSTPIQNNVKYNSLVCILFERYDDSVEYQ
jgi:hypothetical protein